MNIMRRLGSPKLKEREAAIDLRQKGFSYSEILNKVPVAKSTLSVWLSSVGLTKRQQQRLTEKRKAAQLRGGEARRRQRLKQTELIMKEAHQNIGQLTRQEKLIIGTMLYWAEGTKQKEGNWGASVLFSNSDPRMIRIFQKWLFEVAHIAPADISYEIYLHENHKHRLGTVKKFWSKELGILVGQLNRVYFKRNTLKSNRKNQGNEYYGLVRMRVQSSSRLNRRINGWIEGISQHWGVV